MDYGCLVQARKLKVHFSSIKKQSPLSKFKLLCHFSKRIIHQTVLLRRKLIDKNEISDDNGNPNITMSI